MNNRMNISLLDNCESSKKSFQKKIILAEISDSGSNVNMFGQNRQQAKITFTCASVCTSR